MKNSLQNACYAACIVCALQGSSQGAKANQTNSVIPITYVNNFDNAVLDFTPKADTWSEVLRDQFSQKSTTIMSDTFGWQSDINWTRQMNQGYGYNVSFINSGRDSLKNTVRDSLRESIVRIPGVFDSRNWFDELIIGSFARTTEESIRPTDVAQVATQMSWLQEMRSDGNIAYGFRPLDGYMYGSARFGQWDGHPIGIGLIRYHYDPTDLRSRVDEQLSILTSESSALTFGGSYGVTSLVDNKHDVNLSAAWTYSFDNNSNGKTLSIGVVTNKNETFASISFHWGNDCSIFQ